LTSARDLGKNARRKAPQGDRKNLRLFLSGRLHSLTALRNRDAIEFELRKNDVLVQTGNSKDMLFGLTRSFAASAILNCLKAI
jgi:hypothetical protein